MPRSVSQWTAKMPLSTASILLLRFSCVLWTDASTWNNFTWLRGLMWRCDVMMCLCYVGYGPFTAVGSATQYVSTRLKWIRKLIMLQFFSNCDVSKATRRSLSQRTVLPTCFEQFVIKGKRALTDDLNTAPDYRKYCKWIKCLLSHLLSQKRILVFSNNLQDGAAFSINSWR